MSGFAACEAALTSYANAISLNALLAFTRNYKNIGLLMRKKIAE